MTNLVGHHSSCIDHRTLSMITYWMWASSVQYTLSCCFNYPKPGSLSCFYAKSVTVASANMKELKLMWQAVRMQVFLSSCSDHEIVLVLDFHDSHGDHVILAFHQAEVAEWSVTCPHCKLPPKQVVGMMVLGPYCSKGNELINWIPHYTGKSPTALHYHLLLHFLLLILYCYLPFSGRIRLNGEGMLKVIHCQN